MAGRVFVFLTVENYSWCVRVCGFDSDVYILSVTFHTAHLHKDELTGLATWVRLVRLE